MQAILTHPHRRAGGARRIGLGHYDGRYLTDSDVRLVAELDRKIST